MGDVIMKFISWNVNGLRAVLKKGFEESMKALDADFICIQETKMQEGQAAPDFPEYKEYYSYAEKKGYSGTAIFTKEKPISVSYGLGIEEHDHEGRVITAEYPEYYLVTVYVPNAKEDLSRLEYRQVWEDDFRRYLKKLEEKFSCLLPAKGYSLKKHSPPDNQILAPLFFEKNITHLLEVRTSLFF